MSEEYERGWQAAEAAIEGWCDRLHDAAKRHAWTPPEQKAEYRVAMQALRILRCEKDTRETVARLSGKENQP